jgi:hypothetical protein
VPWTTKPRFRQGFFYDPLRVALYRTIEGAGVRAVAKVPTSPRECRKQAAECIRLMHKTTVRHRKQELRQKAAFWLRMAIEMERAEWSVPDTSKPKPKK